MLSNYALSYVDHSKPNMTCDIYSQLLNFTVETIAAPGILPAEADDVEEGGVLFPSHRSRVKRIAVHPAVNITPPALGQSPVAYKRFLQKAILFLCS
ncbi:hypothetical protein HNY73_019992 [Argiope bruennichi]|uniref:Uncharacterized protein n=1 Tax=Argiope bruennichi TaxID=94029 RepID=A0A8T0E6K8_ARGBR|nr:hypothetical protein HNY73_019992 [Argiope bruennichi]